jgi:VanZ family protein
MNSIGRRPFRLACLSIGWLLVLTVTVLSLIPVEADLSEGRDKWSHWLAYSSMMCWFSMLHTRQRTRMWIALALVAMGVLIEFLQGQTGYRSFDVNDMVANTLGVLSGWVVALTPVGQSLKWMEARLPEQA